MVFKYFKTIIIIVCIAVIQSSCKVSSIQKNENDSKMRILFRGFDKYTFLQDSCIMKIYEGEEIIKKINLTEIVLQDEEGCRNCYNCPYYYDFQIKSSNYTILIEHLNIIPIVFVDVHIKEKLIYYFPLNYAELLNIESNESLIIKDFKQHIECSFDPPYNTIP